MRIVVEQHDPVAGALDDAAVDRKAVAAILDIDQVAELEARLATVAGQKREPSERERELERRLQSLTDHLIQKQAQVEALASEKATLALRLEVCQLRFLLASALTIDTIQSPALKYGP